ncbi:hypothetical protein Ab1vBOLIVR5_gp72c [Agrobacterium phage OLIVR5]|uniref:Uncharacterized protein n=3 Tax=Caudoviricetes TaxID=2731619 RepID=A0A858MUX6_9CAUD|nr:hypothetical protein KNU99_gp072 [Agrobacterium phage OLIVR5]QIW87720.1 hypothetical protein Ab1vBOLIVR5_gp72c [Agrobacterium phage OLIVR5]QIW87982.1 hypothetical protein Ab1vBOLIVR6_gp75c [Agrobacterium phage OLIVR6]
MNVDDIVEFMKEKGWIGVYYTEEFIRKRYLHS